MIDSVYFPNLPEQIEANEMWRAKLFSREEEKWLDAGIGMLTIRFNTAQNVYLLKLESELDNSDIYHCAIVPQLQVEKRENTIITVKAEDDLKEVAFSFEDEKSTLEVWEKLNEVLGREIVDSTESESEELPLPVPSISNIEIVHRELTSSQRCYTNRITALFQCFRGENNFLSKLYSVAEIAEERQDTNAMPLIFQILKMLISLNNGDLIALMLNERNFMKTLQILEFDRSPYKYGLISHRAFFTSQVNFINISGILKENIIDLINQNFRLAYLKDTAGAYWLEETTIIYISEMIKENNKDILNYIFDNDSTINEILTEVISPKIDQKLAGVCFLLELCDCSKDFSDTEKKAAFFTKLIKSEAFAVIGNLLSKFQNGGASSIQDTKEGVDKSVGTSAEQEAEKIHDFFHVDKMKMAQVHLVEILNQFFQIVPKTSRKTLLCKNQRNAHYPLLKLLGQIMVESDNDGMKYGIFDLLKLLLTEDCNNAKYDFFEVFIAELFPYFVSSIKSAISENKANFGIELVFSLLGACTNSHGYRIRSCIVEYDMLNHINTLISHCKSKPLVLCGLQFLQSLLSNKYDIIMKQIIRTDALSGIFNLVVLFRRRENALTAVCNKILLQLIEAKCPEVIMYINEKYGDLIVQKSGLYIFGKLLNFLKNFDITKPITLSAKRSQMESGELLSEDSSNK